MAKIFGHRDVYPQDCRVSGEEANGNDGFGRCGLSTADGCEKWRRLWKKDGQNVLATGRKHGWLLLGERVVNVV